MAVTSLLDVHLRQDRLADARAALDAILRDTRAFDGNRGIEVLEDAADPAHAMVVEHWESLQHDDAYRAWRATPEGASGLGEFVATPPVLTRYENRSAL